MRMSGDFWDEVDRLNPGVVVIKDRPEHPVLMGMCTVGEDAATIDIHIKWVYPPYIEQDTYNLTLHRGDGLPVRRMYRSL